MLDGKYYSRLTAHQVFAKYNTGNSVTVSVQGPFNLCKNANKSSLFCVAHAIHRPIR